MNKFVDLNEQNNERIIDKNHNSFVPLHLHTDFSFRDSIAQIPELVSRAKELELPALAITDHGNIMGAIPFYQECKKQDIKPIMGVEAFIVEDTTAKERSSKHIILLAENNIGWENIIHLMSFANTPVDQGGGFFYRPNIDIKQLFKYNEGIIVLTACIQGLIPYWMCHDIKKAEELTLKFKEVFGDRFYLEIQSVNRPPIINIPEQEIVIEVSRDFSKRFNIPIVATNDIHYILAEDAFSHEIWKAISSRKTILDPVISDTIKDGRIKFKGIDYYLQDYQDMSYRFEHDEIVRSLEIAERCNVTINFDATAHMPRYRKDMSDEEVYELLLDRCRKETIRRKLFTKNDTEYVERIKTELADIKEANLQHYFMIVYDVVKDSDAHGIPRGYSRGSAGGSLVSYVLDITRIDPIKYGLFWERFYNKGRKGSMPDIDLDFCILRRERVISYLRQTFGEDKIYPMATISKLAGKKALKDVGRGIGMQFDQLNKMTSIFPHKCNTIKSAIKQSKAIKEMSEGNDDDIRLWEAELKTEKNDDKRNDLKNKIRYRRRMLVMLFKHALRLEGCCRQRSSHPCAILVSDKPIEGKVPISYDAKHKKQLTGWDMYALEKLGFLKLDILGVKSVTVVDRVRNILQQRGIIHNPAESETFNNEDVFQMVARGFTKGIFQIESHLGKTWCKKVKPQTLGEWSDIIALIRPAVLDTGMADTYITNKNQGRIEYIHDDLAKVLETTYGILLYQEQAIEMVKQLAGYSLSDADNLRKAIGKKLPEVMAQHKDKFAEGMKEHGYSQEETEKLWTLLEAGAGYSFNRSHSAGYAMLGYVMAWYKKHYPLEFFLAMLQMSVNEQKSQEEISELYYDAKNYGIEIRPPDIRKANFDFEIYDGVIYYGMGHIKGIGKTNEKKIKLLQTADTPTNLRYIINRYNIGHALLETLIMAGAFDFMVKQFYESRLHMVREFEVFYLLTPKRRQAVEEIINSMHTSNGNITSTDEIPFIKAARIWLQDKEEKVRNDKIKEVINGEVVIDIEKIAQAEKDALGIAIIYCQTQAYQSSSRTIGVGELQRGAHSNIDYEVLACQHNIRVIEKGDKTFIMFQIYDNEGFFPAAMFSEAFNEYYQTLKSAPVVLLAGKISGYGSFVVNKCEIPQKLLK
jgi:DNA polymerase-3 subunit alpha